MSYHKCINGGTYRFQRKDCIRCMRSDRSYLIKTLKKCKNLIFHVCESGKHPGSFDIKDEIDNLLDRIDK